jgi:glycosyltransferase involved in cell wall biosynthesis
MRRKLAAGVRRALRPAKRILAPSPQASGRPLDYGRYLTGRPVGRALLSYLPAPVWHELHGKPTNSFSNQGIANALPRALNELGYAVDIVSFDDVSFRPAFPYDVLVQHGGVNFAQIEPYLPPSAAVIYFATGNYWREWNVLGAERAADFERRHGVSMPHDRKIMASEEAALRRADGIVALGNAVILESYADFPLVFPMDIGVFPDPHSIARDFRAARDHFLFFAGMGNLHKGLDLALEAFAELPQHLHVVTWLDPSFAAFYDELIGRSANIHLHGHVTPRSDRFYEIVSECSFALAPTCAEGQPGAVVECINAGLIPLVTREAHLDVDGFGWVIEPTIEAIRAAVTAAASVPLEALEKRSVEAHRIARERHSPERFVAAARTHLANVLAHAARQRGSVSEAAVPETGRRSPP